MDPVGMIVKVPVEIVVLAVVVEIAILPVEEVVLTVVIQPANQHAKGDVRGVAKTPVRMGVMAHVKVVARGIVREVAIKVARIVVMRSVAITVQIHVKIDVIQPANQHAKGDVRGVAKADVIIVVSERVNIHVMTRVTQVVMENPQILIKAIKKRAFLRKKMSLRNLRLTRTRRPSKTNKTFRNLRLARTRRPSKTNKTFRNLRLTRTRRPSKTNKESFRNLRSTEVSAKQKRHVVSTLILSVLHRTIRIAIFKHKNHIFLLRRLKKRQSIILPQNLPKV